MPYNRPGRGKYVTNNDASAALTHGQAVKEGNFVGVAVKQTANDWDDPVADADQIADGEDYFIITKGVVQVAEVAGFAVGDPVYIDGSNALTEVATGNTKFGRVVEIEDERGTPTNFVRVDLDAKDSF